jgi:hypothetical protein
MWRSSWLGVTVTAAIALLLGCGPDKSDCRILKNCVFPDGGSGGVGGASGGQGPGGSGNGGSTNTCGNGTVDVGEVCFAATFASYPTGQEAAAALAVLDCDGDSDLDVITADRDSMTLTALKNDGNGALTEVSSSGLLPGMPVAIALGDVYGSGSTDVVLGYDNGPIDIYQYTGGCSLMLASPMGGVVSKSVSVLNLDTTPPSDIAGLGDTQVSFAVNFTGGLGTTFSSGATQGRGLSAADVNNDDLDDVVFVDMASAELKWARNDGGVLSSLSHTLSVGMAPVDTAVADVDGDGDDDVVVANFGSDNLTVLKNNGSANFSFSKVLAEPSVLGSNGTPALEPIAVALADLDGDGDIDAVSANSGVAGGISSVSIFLNDGDGTLTLWPGSPMPVDQEPADVIVADINADGVPDIITSSDYVDIGSSNVSVWLSNP